MLSLVSEHKNPPTADTKCSGGLPQVEVTPQESGASSFIPEGLLDGDNRCAPQVHVPPPIPAGTPERDTSIIGWIDPEEAYSFETRDPHSLPGEVAEVLSANMSHLQSLGSADGERALLQRGDNIYLVTGITYGDIQIADSFPPQEFREITSFGQVLQLNVSVSQNSIKAQSVSDAQLRELGLPASS